MPKLAISRNRFSKVSGHNITSKTHKLRCRFDCTRYLTVDSTNAPVDFEEGSSSRGIGANGINIERR